MAFGQQLQLQSTTRIHMAGRCGHFRGHFQSQQGIVGTSLWRGLQGLCPTLTLGRCDTVAKFFGGWQLIGLTMLPSTQQVHQGLAMGLHGQATQCGISLFQGVALGTECRVTQSGSARLEMVTPSRRIGAAASRAIAL